MTARHSAAVARYSREMATALGASLEREQDLIHTAALFHDIGKFIFPDSILLADSRLTDEEYEIVKRHPAAGADLDRARSTATARSPRSSAPTTSASTAAATRTASSATPSRSARASSPSPTSTTSSPRATPTARRVERRGRRRSCAASPARSSTRTSSRSSCDLVERNGDRLPPLRRRRLRGRAAVRAAGARLRAPARSSRPSAASTGAATAGLTVRRGGSSQAPERTLSD